MSKEITITATVDLTMILSGEDMELEGEAVEEEMAEGLDVFKAKIANELTDYIDTGDFGNFDDIRVRDVKVFERDE